MLLAKAKLPTNKLMVKPIPVKIPTAYKEIKLELLGISANLNLIARNEKANTPICFPKNRPHKIPRGTGLSKDDKLRPSNDTPALAKANIGIIPNATYGDIECSNFNSMDFFSFFVLCGIVRANKTPAIVACIPD